MRDLSYFDLLDEAGIKEEIEKEEAGYRAGIEKAAHEILHTGAKLVFLAGPSCSGKTTTSLLLRNQLEKKKKRVFSFSTDDFFFNQEFAPRNEDGTANYDAFSHIDSLFLREVLRKLAMGRSVLLPEFDFLSGSRKKDYLPLSPAEQDIIILEGIHALNDQILNAVPQDFPVFRIALDITEPARFQENEILQPDEIRFIRRLIRDFKHRNASAERTFSLWSNVRSAEKEWIAPFVKNADIFLKTNFPYEICVEKEQLIRLLEKTEESHPFYSTASALISRLSGLTPIPEAMVPEESPLCEFIH